MLFIKVGDIIALVKKAFKTLFWSLVPIFIGIFIVSVAIDGFGLVKTNAEKLVSKVVSFSLTITPAPEPESNTDFQIIEIKSKEPEFENIKLTFLGDVMMDRGVETSVINNFGGDYNKLFENLSRIKDSDISFINLEGPVSDKGENVGSKYSFRMDPVSISALKNAGVDIVSLANNHAGDYSVAALIDSINRLHGENIKVNGAGTSYSEATELDIFSIRGKTIGFLSFTDVGPNWLSAKNRESQAGGEERTGILLANDSNFENIILEADKKVDYLVTSFHWGEEYKAHNERQTSLAHKAIDNGADIVVGHHPHVIQDVEVYKGKPIAYSLGNAIFDQYFSAETMEGLVFEVEIGEDNILGYRKNIFKLSRSYQPQTPEIGEFIRLE